MLDKGVHLILWVFIGAIVVLIVTHAQGFSTAVSAVGGQVTNDASLLAGYAPQGAKLNTGGTQIGATLV